MIEDIPEFQMAEKEIERLKTAVRFYEDRLRPKKDMETGATEDEIDRLEFELEMKNVNMKCVQGWLSEAKQLLKDALCVMNAHAIGHKTQEAIESFLKEDL